MHRGKERKDKMDTFGYFQQQAPAEKADFQYNDGMSLENNILFQKYNIKGYTENTKKY